MMFWTILTIVTMMVAMIAMVMAIVCMLTTEVYALKPTFLFYVIVFLVLMLILNAIRGIL